MKNRVLLFVAVIGLALAITPAIGPVHPAAQQQVLASTGLAPGQLPPSAQRMGNLPFRNVQSSYSPVGKYVSPQDGFVMQQHPVGPTPRDADGHPDLSGNWGADFPNPIGSAQGNDLLARRLGSVEPDQAALQRGAQWNKPLYKPEYWERVRSLDFGKADVDPNYGCGKPSGVPRQNVPARIVQKDRQIWLLNGGGLGGLRIVPLDGRKHDPLDGQYSTFNGLAVAEWDGDTLVIDSVGFNDVTWLGWEGYFHTDRMSVIERLRREGNLLYYNFTVNDPDVLIEPWTSYTYVRKLNPQPQPMGDPGECSERDINLLADPYLRG